MTSPKRSPLKKNLSLCRNNGLNKRARLDSSISEDEALKKKENFVKACLKVSYEGYKNIRRRFQLIYLPSCIDSCTHGEKNTNLKQISKSAEQNFKIEMNNHTWNEALEICLVCITSSQYLSTEVLKDIVEIILNAHEDLSSGYSIECLLQKCQHTLSLHFNMHPPCIIKDLRDCYRKFLSSPIYVDPKKQTFSNRKQYYSDEGIVSYCMARLASEIDEKSTDGTLVDPQEPPKNVNGVMELHWKTENLELFEFLNRIQRIDRLMLVLECLINLLLTDLALCHIRSMRATERRQTNTKKPLLTYVVWPNNSLINGTVTRQCSTIMELFAHFIHLRYPESHIKTMSLWMNALIELFYMYEVDPHKDYPTPLRTCKQFAEQFNKIILPLPTESVLRILERIKPCMRHLIGEAWVQKVLDNSFTIQNIILNCADDMSWNGYTAHDELRISKTSCVKPHKLLDYLSKKCRTFKSGTETADVPGNIYPKLQLLPNKKRRKQDYFIDILFKTYIAYLDAYDMKNIHQTLDYLNENIYSKGEIDYDPDSCKPYCVTDIFVKECRHITQSCKELLLKLNNNNDKHSKTLLHLINNYFS